MILGRRAIGMLVCVAALGLAPLPAGAVVEAPAPGFHPMQPTRLMDTRSGLGGGRFATGQVSDLQVGGVGGVPGDAIAVALNVTVTEPSAAGFLTLWPTGSSLPTASNLNFVPGQTVPNMVTVGLGAGGRISIYNAVGAANVVIDVTAWFSSGFHPLQPSRLMDSRLGQGGPAFGPGESRLLQVAGVGPVPFDATAVALNVTVTEPTAASYLTVWPAGSGVPTASNLNFVPGQTVPNMVTVGVGASGRVSLFNLVGTAHVIVDVTGWYAAGFHPVVPGRVMDSRIGQCGFKLHAGEQRDVAVAGLAGVPTAGAGGVALNVTATGSTAATFLTLWPSGAPRPLASNLNVVAGTTVANMALVGVGAGGRVSLYNLAGDVDVVIDVDGWFDGDGPGSTSTACVVATPPPPPPPPPVPTTTPLPAPVGFGDGTYIVGQQVPPGRYQSPGGNDCYWERLRGFGGQIGDIVANDFGRSHVIVDIAPSDAGFHTEDCGRFTPYVATGAPAASMGDGAWVVNEQILAGMYSAPGGDSCYWERLRAFGGSLVDIIANDFDTTNPVVSVAPSDQGFTSDDCGTWTRVGS